MLGPNTGRGRAEHFRTGVGGIAWYYMIYDRHSSIDKIILFNCIKLLLSEVNR